VRLVRVDGRVKALIVVFLVLHLADYAMTMYFVNFTPWFEEANVCVKWFVETSPATFTLIFAVSLIHFYCVILYVSWLRKKYGIRRPILTYIIAFYIACKAAVLANNLYSVWLAWSWGLMR